MDISKVFLNKSGQINQTSFSRRAFSFGILSEAVFQTISRSTSM